MDIISFLLNPPSNLSIYEILAISFILGILHGITPDEHTWPITFSYAIGSYSTKGGMKAGLLFSLGFTIQRGFLTFLGYIGLAYIYQKYNLDGPVYIAVGFVMAIVGYYVLKGRYFHIPLDKIFGAKEHHTEEACRVPPCEVLHKEIPIKMTFVHGLIAGFGFGAYATIITFVLSPMVGSVYLSPLPGIFFGLGTMVMQVIIGALFGSILRTMKFKEEDIKYVGIGTASKTLYYGGIAFIIIGIIVILIPPIDDFAISTGLKIPNIDAINIGLILVLFVVGIIGIYSLIKSYYEIKSKYNEIEKNGQK